MRFPWSAPLPPLPPPPPLIDSTVTAIAAAVISVVLAIVIAILATRKKAGAKADTGVDASGQRSRAAQQADGLVVVGGGLAGLAAAAALTRVAGVQRVSVLERSSAAAFGDEQAGAAAQLGPNGLRALRFIGGDETLAAVRSAGTDLAGTAIHPGGGAAVMLIPDPAKADTGLPQVLTPEPQPQSQPCP